jgi:putative ABC transport system permease protein
VRSWETIGVYYSYVNLVDIAIAVMSLFFLLAGSTVIIVTTIMVIFERMREIGTIAAMGMTGSEIVRLFFMETFFLSVIAAFVGLAIGIGLTIPLSIYGIDFTETMKDLNMEISNIVYPNINPFKMIFVYFYSVAIASLSTLIPSRRAAKIQPVVALRSV